jgi:hypothetical protein
MTLSPCDLLAERVALGEPLAELTAHAQTCARCAGLVAMSSQLGATHHAVDPGLGFSARMTVGAQHRITVRRRRRLAAGLAASVAGGMFGVFLVTRAPEPTKPMVRVPDPQNDNRPVVPDEATPAGDDDLAALVQLADTDRSSRLSAHWGRIEKPLAPYKQVLEGVEP